MNKLRKILSDFNEFVMFKHTIFSLPFIFIAMIVAADGWFGWRLFFLGLLAAVFARNFAMGVNRYLDRDIDRLNPRTANRPSVDGRIPEKVQILFIVANAIGFIITAFFINTLAFVLSPLFLLILGGYSYFKRFSELAHLVLGVALGLAPIAGVIAVKGAITLWSIFLSLGVIFWVAGFDLLYSLQDMEFDKQKGLYSIPSRYGAACTLFIAKIFHALTILFWLFFVIEAHLGFFAYSAVVVAAGMLTYEHKIVDKDFTKIDRAFFTVNGYLGIIFLLFIIVDEIF
ncbi:4-hydroxybenzoate polyprenyltransferase [Nitratiruptor sp. YY08-26]|uniref:menaquinone biosynthesis prenyltransferase MqnP n=1 Tax=unclassified Nitratiruptor TaxID=2624044 RepID=UPI0019155630|nr:MULTISPECIES: menaquinone biosynthesis prenyltransferase MqnP [unclassified Nitratiruptor]BCD61499.1 4-hydroxybenzoate polyprenyltransferase [Nitratiruptor sp. YY08-13]BCD65433.1 4-hydroxybenzoate polyprenyltransferase [Nitratiruptor sp. YY08-26]